MSYLIEHPETGERQHVGSLDAYPDWTVLKDGPDAKPKEHADFVGGKWRVNTARKAAAEKQAARRTKGWEAVVEELEARIAALEARQGP